MKRISMMMVTTLSVMAIAWSSIVIAAPAVAGGGPGPAPATPSIFNRKSRKHKAKTTSAYGDCVHQDTSGRSIYYQGPCKNGDKLTKEHESEQASANQVEQRNPIYGKSDASTAGGQASGTTIQTEPGKAQDQPQVDKVGQGQPDQAPPPNPTRIKAGGGHTGLILLGVLGAGGAAAGVAASSLAQNQSKTCGAQPNVDVCFGTNLTPAQQAQCQQALAAMGAWCQCEGYSGFNGNTGSCQ